MNAQALNRVIKLERKHRRQDAVFFMVWGPDLPSLLATLERACAAGDVRKTDIAAPLVWPFSEEPPSPRWILKGDRFDDRENDALNDILRSLGPADAKWPGPMTEMTDAELYAVAIGRPAWQVLAASASQTEH
jgi:hypothetical protein